MASQTRIQEIWLVMLEGSEMQKFEPGRKAKLKGLRPKQVYLSGDMEAIVYVPMKKKGRISISSISSVQSGENTPEDLQMVRNKFPASTCFSLVSTEFIGRVYFAAPSADIANLWIKGIRSLIKIQDSKSKGIERREMWLTEAFNKLDVKKSGSLKFVDLLKFLTSHGIHPDPSFVKKVLKKFLRENNLKEQVETSVLGKEEFSKFLKLFLTRQEVLNLFKKISADGALITIEDLKYFLTREQHITSVTDEYCETLIDNFEVTQVGQSTGELGIDGFTKYLMSNGGELFNPAHERVYQDMTQPLTHYFVASSHNTYLLGDQLKDDSSVQAYVNVLEEGCRCVELDCWDGDDGEPIVYHGHTWTSKILFKDILLVVKDHAFKVTPYPLILTLENHCSVEFQKKMARHLVDILGEFLFRDAVDASRGSFPSPESLKHKIFVRGKKLKPEHEQCDEEFTLTDDEADSDEDDDDDDDDGRGDGRTTSGGKIDDNLNGSSKAARPSTDKTDGKGKKKPPKPLSKELSLLINYFSNVHFVNFEHSKANGKYCQSSSFVEKKMMKFIDKSAADFVEYNKCQFSRIYPGNLRVDSSNYNPQQAWNAGCQIVALNHQTHSEPMHLHHGKFRQNGKAGYVLKPVFLRDPGIKFDPKTVDEQGIRSKFLKVTVISGQRLPAPDGVSKEELDPYVKIDIYGVPADDFSYTTKTVMNNGYNPIWNESFQRRVLVPELAMVRFCVYDEDIGYDDFIGQTTLPFTSLQPGYRHVTLLNKKDQSATCGSLFVRLTISESEVAMTLLERLGALPGEHANKKCLIL